MCIGNRVKALRIDLSLSVDQVAEMIGKNRATIYRYENNDIENIPISVLDSLAKALHTTPGYLMGLESSSHVSSITFDDFTYSLCSEAQKLTEENKQKLLEMALFFQMQQEKEKK